MSSLLRTDDLFFAKTGMDPVRVQRMVDDALTGVDDGELFMEFRRSENLVWDDNRLRNASYDATQGFGLRAVAEEATGFAHSVTFDEHSIKRAVETVRAVRTGSAGSIALPPPGSNRRIYGDVDPLDSMGFDAKIALLQEIDGYVRALDPRVHQVTLSLSGSWQAVQIMRAGGFRSEDIRPLVQFYISVVTKQGDRLETGYAGSGGRADYARWVHPDNWQGMAKEALRKALVNLDAIEAPAGEMTVVLGPGEPAVLLHEAIGHGLEGDFNRKRTSAFCDLMGQRVAVPGVTIVDDGTLDDARGSITMDDEGTPSQCTTLVEDGILVGFMQDRMNARLMGTKPTGNGRRESFAYSPYPRMTNTIMRAGTTSPAEIIASVDKGIYAVDFSGGQVDITSGKFVFNANEAYMIEGGKIGRPIKGASLVGSGFDALTRISMIGNDYAIDAGVGTCGKNGQGVPVGNGQPTIKLDRMTVGGRAE